MRSSPYTLLLLVFAFLLLGRIQNADAQTEEKNWYFGNGIYGLRITDNAIQVVNDKASLDGGAMAIATVPSTGDIIFYTDGRRVIDASHAQMPNGVGLWNPAVFPLLDFLYGIEEPYSQTVGITPKPNDCGRYYIFTNTTNTYNGDASELRYFLVDAEAAGNGTLANPLGDVMDTPYASLLTDNTSEGMITTRSDRKNQYWLVYHTRNTNNFQVLSINNSGIAAAPSTYSLGAVMTVANLSIYYVDKQNAKIAVAPKTPGTNIILLNMNLVTGALSLDRTIAGAGYNDSPDANIYDTAWSSDGTKLYYSRMGTPIGNNGGVYQVDLATNAINLVSPQTAGSYSIKKAPNGSIYHLSSNIFDGDITLPHQLNCIENPNGNAVDYRANPVALSTYNSLPVRWTGKNFPEFMPIDNLAPIARDTAIFMTCFPSPNPPVTIDPIAHDYDPDGDDFRIETDITAQVGTVQTDATGLSITYTPPASNNCFTADTITYAICEYPKDIHCFYRCDTAQVFICLQPTDFTVSTSSDVQICPGQQTQLSVTGGSNYSWSNPETLDNPTSSTPIASPLSTTIYTVTVTQDDDCPIFKEANVIVTVATPDIVAPNINWQTNGEPCIVLGDITNINVLPDGATASDYQVRILTDPADYFAQNISVVDFNQNIRYNAANNNACTTIDEFTYELCDLVCGVCDEGVVRVCLETEGIALDAGEDITICAGETTILTATGSSSYLWDNGSSSATITVNPLQTTTYNVTATDTDGCTSIDDVTITVIEPPVTSLTAGANTCNAAESGASTTINLDNLILEDTGGTWTADATNPVNVLLADPTSIDFDGLPAGTYNFTYTLIATAPCTNQSATTTINVADCNCPNVNTIATNETLCNDTGTFNLQSLEDTDIEAGTWSIGNTADFTNPASIQTDGITFDATNADAGTYILTYTLDNPFGGDCPASSSQSIIVYETPRATAGRQEICLGNSIELNASGGMSYQWEDGTNNASITVAPTSNQTYQVTVTGEGNCSVISTFDVVVITPPNASLSAGTSVCNSTASGESTSLNFDDFVEGDTNGTWQETGTNSGVDLSNTNIVNFVDVTPATYTFEYTVAGIAPCTTTSETIDIIVNNCDCPIVSTLAPSNPICNNTTFNLADLMPNTIATGVWSISNTNNFTNPATLQTDGLTFDATNADAGSYELTYTLTIPVIGICPVSSTQTIEVNALPTASITGNTIICIEESTNLIASGGTSYIWNNGETTSAIEVSPSINTSFEVTITTDAGCSSTTSTSVTVLGEQPIVNDDLYTDCVASGATNTLTSPLLNDQGLNPDSVIVTIMSIQLGQATINPTTQEINYTALADNACIANDTLTYEVCHISCNSLCDSGQIVVCLATDGFDITVSENQEICPGETANLSASGATRYEWQPTTSLDNPSSATPTASPTETTTYTVTAYDDFDCTSTGSVTISINNDIPIANSDEENTNCVAITTTSSLDILSNDQFSTSPFTEIISVQLGTATINPDATLSYTAPIANACTLFDTIQYRICNPTCPSLCDTTFVSICLQTEGIPANAGEDATICQGASTTLTASGGVRYEWSPATSLDDPTSASPTATPLSTTTYTVTVYDANNCSGVDDITITIDDTTPQLTNTNENQCLSTNESTTLNLFNQCNNCTDASDLVATILPSNSIGTAQLNGLELSYTAPSTNPCTTSDTIEFQICRLSCADFCDTAQWVLCLNQEGLTIDIQAPTIICQGDSVQLQASGGTFYNWQATNGIQNLTTSNPYVSPTQTTTYTVEGNDGNTCTGSSSIEIVVDIDEVNASEGTTLFLGESTTLTASSGFDSYTWFPATGLDNPNSQSPLATPDTTTTYLLTAINVNGCSYQDSVQIIVNDNCDPVRMLPSAFSPNNDGMNDQLQPLSTNIENYELLIYNRWGNLVFESTDPLLSWDGTWKNEIQPLGVYVFSLRFNCKGKAHFQKGHITLMR